MSVIAVSPNIGPIKFDCVLSEKHTSDLEITGNPIEIGSEVNDHAYLKPKQVILDAADNNAASVFNSLLAFQKTRVPFYMVTGLTLYKNMLVQSIDVTRDKDTSFILRVTVILREVIIVSTGVAPTSSRTNSSRAQPGGSNSTRSVTPSRETATDAVTSDVVGGTVTQGDMPIQTVPESSSGSLLKGIFG